MPEIFVPKKLYPTPENFQRSGDIELPIGVAISELQRFTKNLPEGIAADSVVVRPWASLEVWGMLRRSPLEIAQKQNQVLLEALARAANGLSADDVRALIARSNAV